MNISHHRICLEQIEKRRAEVNEEMAQIVNRFEAATEALQLSAGTHNNSVQNNSKLERSNADNHMDQSEDDNYYQNNFKTAVNKRNDESTNKHGNGDDSSNDDTNDEEDSSSLKQGNKMHFNFIA